jgi:cell division protein FtsL
MFNNTKTDIIDRNTYVDEFEREAPQVATNVETQRVQTAEEIAFNSRISDNFDRILHYDTYNQQNSVKERNETYQMYSQNVNFDANPSSTTMQFYGMPKAEIYQDYKVQTEYSAKAVVRPRAKLLMFALSVVICLLSTLVIFNTALLKDLNALIDDKNAQVEQLTEDKVALEEVLEDVSNRN